MILTNSIAAKVGTIPVIVIAHAIANFRIFLCYLNTTISSAISGTIGLIKNGVGKLTLLQICDYTGETKINAGSLEITSASTLNGVISGAGQLTKTGTTALTIGGSNTYSGGTLSAPTAATGTITFSQNNAFGTGLFTSAGPSQIIANATTTLANNFQINSGNSLQFRVATVAITLTIPGSIAGSGSISKTSNGRLHLDGTLSYTGSTAIIAGFLRAIQTVGDSTATATFQNASLAVSFNVSPPAATTTNFRFFQGTTVQTYTPGVIALAGVPVGTTATYTSATSTLAVTVP